MDYPLEDSLDPGKNKIITSAFKHALTHSTRETCGVFYWINKLAGIFEFSLLKNSDTHDKTGFLVNDPFFYDLLFNDKIISIFHSHIDSDPSLSPLDIEVSKSFNLPSFVFSLTNKESYLYYPSNYKAPPLQGRFFVPIFQDCITFVKDFFDLNLNIKLSEHISDWSRKRYDSNNYLLSCIEKCFIEVPLFTIRTNDLVVMNPSIGHTFHLGVIVENELLYHHPLYGLPKKELFHDIDINQVYKVYRYKDL